MLEELRISSLGVIDESVLELGPGFTAITGETGAGKTMVVTALGLLLGGRADSGAVRTGAKSARVEGLVRSDSPALAAAVDAVGGEVEDGRLVLARQISAEGRSRAFAGGAAVPVSSLAALADPLVAVHGQSDQHRLLRPAAQRDALDSFAGAKALKLRARFGERYAALRATEAELADVVRVGPGAGPRGRPAALRARRGRGGRPAARRGGRARRGGVPARLRGHAAHRRRAGPRVPVRRGRRSGRARHRLRRPQAARRGARARPRRGRAGRPARRDQLPALRRGRRRGVVRQRPGHRPGPAGRGLRTTRGAGRAHPQVRRDDRGRAGLVASSRPSGCSSWTTPTSGSSSSASSATASGPSSPPSAPTSPRPGPRRPPRSGGW